MPSSYTGEEPICSSGMTGESQQLTILEAETSLTGNEWQKHATVTGPEALCIFGTDYLRKGYFKGPKEYHWAFTTAALETEEIKQLSAWPFLSEDPSVVGLLKNNRCQSLPQWCTSSNTAPTRLSRNLERDQGLAWKYFGTSLEEKVTHTTEQDPLCNKSPENEKWYALFTDCSATLLERSRDRVSYDESLKEKVNRLSLQRWKPSSWL